MVLIFKEKSNPLNEIEKKNLFKIETVEDTRDLSFFLAL